jgi:hypothetical protein
MPVRQTMRRPSMLCKTAIEVEPANHAKNTPFAIGWEGRGEGSVVRQK